MTLITYQFFHADIVHLVGNMIFLWVFGDDVERALGRLRFLAFYLLSGVIGGLVFVASEPHSTIELIGASGSIAGVVIAYVMLRPCAKITVLLGIIPLRISAYWVIGLFVIIQLWNLGSASKSEVAYWCHIGGMLAGAIAVPADEAAGRQAVRVHAAACRTPWCRSGPPRRACPMLRPRGVPPLTPQGGAPLGCRRHSPRHGRGAPAACRRESEPP